MSNSFATLPLFTEWMIEARGWVNDRKFEAFLALGYTNQPWLCKCQ
ncbi:MAG: hypothetical protein MUD14_02695 [Hydrococcus sp. Prado102]|nr:hypothetical protein [Hydrococcus sp. Prado102]